MAQPNRLSRFWQLSRILFFTGITFIFLLVGFGVWAAGVKNLVTAPKQSLTKAFNAFKKAAPVKAAPMVVAGCTGISPNIVCTSSNGITATANNVGNQNSTPSPAAPYPSTNVVTANGTVNSVAVRLNGVSHLIPDNMDMLLVAPGGQAFVFWGDVGGFGGGAGTIANQTYTISDSAATDLPDSTAPAGGTYKPKNYFTFNDIFPASGSFAGVTASSTNSASPLGTATFGSVFGGINANGTWQLFVAYDGPETGTITSWDLLLDVNASNACDHCVGHQHQ